jgi:HD-GYP domain-containing protein (c-di-GMP phosphodiesterase class II)
MQGVAAPAAARGGEEGPVLKKISTRDLKPGMYVVDMGLSWLENPYLYSQVGVVGSEGDVLRIQREGFMEVFVDTRRSLGGDGTDGLSDEEAISAELARDLGDEDPLAPTVSLAEEMPQARALYDDSVGFARKAMDVMRKDGFVDVQAAQPMVEGILTSVTRNANALLGLSKLRSVDEYTYTHCINVAVLAVVFGRHLGFGDITLSRVGLAGLFHDLGKARVPDTILNSPRRLTPDEFSIMKRHPELGWEQVRDNPMVYDEVLAGMLEHHEKYNGLGYPRGLKGEEISIIARILAVVDVYDALTSRRVYKAAMLPHKALGLMYGMRGQDFHPGFVERFIRCLGIYPVGSVVELNTGQRGVVSKANAREPLLPEVIVVRDPKGRPAQQRRLDLSGQTAVKVVACLDPRESGIDPGQVLGTS